MNFIDIVLASAVGQLLALGVFFLARAIAGIYEILKELNDMRVAKRLEGCGKVRIVK